MNSVQQIKVSDIAIGQRLRQVDADHVELLVISISECGFIQNPVVVHEQKHTKKLKLVAGAHRLAAAKRAGLDTIPATILKGKTKDELRLIEIQENLIRHELNPLDRAAFLAECKKLYEQLHPETKNGAQGGRGENRNEMDILSFSKNTAEKLGVDRKTVDRAVELHQRLSPDVRKQIAGTRLARNQSELVSLSKLAPDMQVKVAAIILDAGNEAEKVAAAVAVVGGHTPKPAANSGEAKVRRAYDAFNRLNKREQDRVLGMIGEPRLLQFVNKTVKPILKAAD